MNKLLIIFYLLSSSVRADCNFTSRLSDLHVDWSSITSEVKQSVKTSNKSVYNSKCRFYFYTFSKGSSGNYNRKLVNKYGDKLDYNIFLNSGQRTVLKDFSDLRAGDKYVRGKFSSISQIKTNDFYFNLNRVSGGAGPLVRAGVYKDSITMSLYSSLLIYRPVLEQTQLMNISTVVPKEVHISLVDTGASFDKNDTEQTLDFGELEKGELLSFDLRIQSNAGYIVSFSSQNLGKLKHITSNKRIRYKLTVDGRRRNLRSSRGVEVARARGVTQAGGNVHNVAVKIGRVKNKPHGYYADYITVTTMTIE